MKLSRSVFAVACLAAGIGSAQAAEAGDWTVKFGLHEVAPASSNGTLANGALKTDVGDDFKPSLQVEYLFTPNLGLEVLAALPFKHDVTLNGVQAATVKELPPTVSLQWHFNPQGPFNPFVGVGLNFTRFFSIDETGPLAGTQLNLSDSWGLGVHAGVDYALNERWLVSADVRWINIETTARVDGAKVGTVKIDPVAYGLAVGYRF